VFEVGMQKMTRRARFLAALAGEPVDRPPVWLMRQAGRYLPGYRATREANGFWDVCKNPELSTHVALEPLEKFAIDAAIVFSDILVVPEALGLGVTFGKGEGPQLARPMRSAADLAAWQIDGVQSRMSFVSNAVAHLAKTLNGSHGILGFAGAPFTLFAYSVEGGGSDDFRHARTMLHTESKLAERALATLADVVTGLLEAECEAGADVVQLFDTWGGLLTRAEYARFAIPALQRITRALKAKGRRTMLFVRGGHHLLPLLGESGVDGFSLDWRTPWAEARAAYPNHLLQGNLDPVLLHASPTVVRAATRGLLDEMAQSKSTRNIANLGHGITPQTPPECVAAMCDEVAARGS
jgi:uroporphyrinogen decarboxylase